MRRAIWFVNVPLVLNAALSRIETPLVPVTALVSEISVTIKRPTNAQPLAWGPSDKLRVTILFVVDGVEYQTVGTVSGGVRTTPHGEIQNYTLRYRPTVLFGKKAQDYLATATPDAEGFYANVPLTRLGELGTTLRAGLILERLSGSIATSITVAAFVDAPAPILAKHHNSVAFDAATEGYESGGDGVVSVTHTAGGADRAVFIGSGVASLGNAITGSSSATYGGAGATELWDVAVATYYGNAGYVKVAPATGAQTVTVTVGDSAPTDQGVGVISMTGVHQSTPTGTAATATGNSAAPSVTVSAPASDSLVVDNLMTAGEDRSAVGSGQTERISTINGFLIQYGSTQLGSSGGVMSWTLNNPIDWSLGAVEFKASAGGGGSNNGAAVRHYRRMTGIG